MKELSLEYQLASMGVEEPTMDDILLAMDAIKWEGFVVDWDDNIEVDDEYLFGVYDSRGLNEDNL
jgi:hypothetical protein